jgi:hypothetical protein
MLEKEVFLLALTSERLLLLQQELFRPSDPGEGLRTRLRSLLFGRDQGVLPPSRTYLRIVHFAIESYLREKTKKHAKPALI